MIKLRQFTKVRPARSGYHTMLDGIDFTIRPGEKIGILARNGAGKMRLFDDVDAAYAHYQEAAA